MLDSHILRGLNEENLRCAALSVCAVARSAAGTQQGEAPANIPASNILIVSFAASRPGLQDPVEA